MNSLPPESEGITPVLLVTGMSGAGKSVALKALEDLGYEAVDNLPLSLLQPLLSAPTRQPLAIGIDSRTRAFDSTAILARINDSARAGRPVRILFLDCAGSELVNRFSETRRRHPLAGDRPAGDGIAREREVLGNLRRAADVVIDTTDYSSNDLRRAIATRFRSHVSEPLTLTIMSFGYARGVPRDADLMFDMRFLRNPHWQPELRPLTGSDPRVARHVMEDPAWPQAFAAIMNLLAMLMPGYAGEGRAYVTVAFGCTGGRHRSVAAAEAAGKWLAKRGWANTVVHRDQGFKAAAGVPEDRDVSEQPVPDVELRADEPADAGSPRRGSE
ncbi:MAG: RNase adapter RapZ [Sphingomonadaceae bacterium]